ncbi:alpha-L-rhamnosidase [Filimonas lacunae]|uniref:alpha-L-rhamnosidase n=1 Tax=Filimonas lacunae TaxID=477680 RepID=A0A173MDX7_9BACT|nr:family 78 glycoside hydrolase catalytic domain [Filimonas lacunae]BAV05727.1 alpha-L-rhamnosidase [Filimonas lacunae]SIT28780.1 alpha-L-rhamnosidase [Filimonas lacunae]
MFTFLKHLFLFLFTSISLVKAQQLSWSEKAQWISTSFREDSTRPSPVFTKQFTITGKVQNADVYITAHGVYMVTINGKRVGDAYFAPGWTNYDKRLQYQQYNLKPYLKPGNNQVEVTIGEGWYRGQFGGLMLSDNYGKEASLLFQINLQYANGAKSVMVSDSTWLCRTGKIRHSDIYGGECYDAGYQPGNWQPVQVKAFTKQNLVPTINEPVTKQETFAPVRVWLTPKKEQVIDFGQNLAGWVQFTVTGKKGDTIQVEHAEVLDKEGNFYTGNLREAKATDTYILKGGKPETFEPHFTWHGFRYVKVTGATVKPHQWKAIALYSNMQPAGEFSCSDTFINRLQHNILWSLKGNFLDIPTDCPQRSERFGWTGDAHAFFRSATFNYNVKDFFAKWLADLASEQRPDGSVPNIIPNIYKNIAQASKTGRAGWGDAAVIIPWTHYWIYGDTSILQAQYPSMKAWVEYINSVSKDYLWTGNGYGDWLAPGDSTSLPYIDQCFWAYSTQLLIHTANVLGKVEDSLHYTSLLNNIKTTFRKYIQPDGKAITHTQTAYVLALQFNMLPDSMQPKAINHLVTLIKENNYHLSTGFLGTPYLLFALSNNGHTDIAYKLLMQDTYPSWLYPVKMGATTIWEKWDAIKPDSSVQATSYNHYAYGAVAEWLYRIVAGIDLSAEGYRHIIIRPQPGGGLTWAKAVYQSPYGKIVSQWQRVGKKIKMQVEIPANTQATIYIPGKGSQVIQQRYFSGEGEVE